MNKVVKRLGDIVLSQVPGALAVNSIHSAVSAQKRNNFLRKDVLASSDYSLAPIGDEEGRTGSYIIGQAFLDVVSSLQVPMYATLGLAVQNAEQLSDIVTGPVVAFGILAPLFSYLRSVCFTDASENRSYDREDHMRLETAVYANTLADPDQAGSIAVHSLSSGVAELHYAGQEQEQGALALSKPGAGTALSYVLPKVNK